MKYIVISISVAFFLTGCDSSVSIEDPNKSYFVKFYGTGGDQTGQDFVVLPDGNMILFGTTRLTVPTKGTQWYLVKIDPKGNVFWEKEFGGLNNEEARDIELTSSNQIVLVGNSYKSPTDRDVMIMTLTTDGVKIDSAVLPVRDSFGAPTAGDEDAAGVTETNDGFLIAGSTTATTVYSKPVIAGQADTHDALKIRVFTDLTIYPSSWTQTYGYYADDASLKIYQVSPSLFHVFGYTNSPPPGQSVVNYNFWVFPLGANGDATADQIYPGTSSGDEKLSSACISPVGYFLGGLSQNSASSSDIFISEIRTPGSLGFKPGPVTAVPPGDIFYEKTLSVNLGNGLPERSSVFPSGQGGFYVLANENGFDSNQNWVLTRVYKDGSLAWSTPIVFGGEGLDNCGSIQELPDGRLVLIGTMRTGRPDAGEFKLTVVKVSGAGKFE